MDDKIEKEVKHSTIYAALAAAQRDMGPVLKENTNPAFKSRYADLSNVVGACLPALNKHGIAVFQPMRDVEGKRFIVTILAHESGETIENPVELIVGKNDMQGLGSAMTYARRYGLMAMAGVAPEDDDGNAAVVAAPKQQPRQQPVQRQEGPDPVEMAVKALSGAETLEALSAIWASVRQVQREASVIAAKDKRKAELSEGAGE